MPDRKDLKAGVYLLPAWAVSVANLAGRLRPIATGMLPVCAPIHLCSVPAILFVTEGGA